MGEHIQTTGIKPGEITDGKYTMAYGVEQLCSVVDHEVVPAIRSMCRTQKKHEGDIDELRAANGGQRVDIATLQERSLWTKAIIFLGISGLVTAIFTLIVAVIIPAFGG